jgi:hypothetical protein
MQWPTGRKRTVGVAISIGGMNGNWGGLFVMAKEQNYQYSKREAERCFAAALRGARLVGHKPQSEMKLGKPRGKPKESPVKRRAAKPQKE